MIKITNGHHIGGNRHVGEMCFSRGEALHTAERFDKQGREPVIERPLSGSKAWFIWIKD